MASVTRVAASNTPTNPGEAGSATPKPMIPCSRNAPSAGTASPKARKHTANAAAFTSHCTTDQPTTPRNRPGLFSTSSPARFGDPDEALAEARGEHGVRDAAQQGQPRRRAVHHEEGEPEHGGEHHRRAGREPGDRRGPDLRVTGES